MLNPTEEALEEPAVLEEEEVEGVDGDTDDKARKRGQRRKRRRRKRTVSSNYTHSMSSRPSLLSVISGRHLTEEWDKFGELY